MKLRTVIYTLLLTTMHEPSICISAPKASHAMENLSCMIAMINDKVPTDLTGHRRWLPFMIEVIDSPWERATDYDGIYAQAYALWQQGFRYWFNDEENAELEQHNRQFEEPNMEEELILTYLRQPYGDEAGEFLTATRIIELIGMYVKCPLSPKRVAFAMNRLGYRQRRVGGVRGYNVIILTGNDIKEQQRFKARNSDPI